MIELTAPCAKSRHSYDRCVSLERTLELVPELRAKYGITRVGNVTRLDRIGIPTFCAIAPASPNVLSVYNGKGVSDEAAIVSAILEAVERHTAVSPDLQARKCPAAQISKLIDLGALGLNHEAYDAEIDCVEGSDLLNGRRVPIPLEIAQFRRSEAPIFPAPTSNGLAAGNTLIEAAYHALCELIERHAWSLYRVRCELLPRLLAGPAAGNLNFASQLQIPCGNAVLDRLCERVQSAGLHLRIMFLRERHLPPVFLASIVEERSHPPMSHVGLGCSLSPAHAAIRAVTEAAQSRLTDIQGAREDALRADDARSDMMPELTRRLSKPPKDVWFYDLPAHIIELQSIADASTRDLAADLGRVVAGLASFGASSVSIVDLSPPDIAVKVVRAIVPELETTCIDGRIGPKARDALNPFSTSPIAFERTS